MPFPLHKSPKGLLELFRLRTLGAQPNSFVEGVAGVVDITEFYSNDLQGIGQSSFAAENFPMSVVFTEERVTRYLAINGGVTMGAAGGTWLKMTLCYRPTPASTANVAVASSLVANPVATQLYRFQLVFANPWVLPAGAQWLLFAESDAAGADHTPMIRTLVQLLDGSR